jgi:hypothetical protein
MPHEPDAPPAPVPVEVARAVQLMFARVGIGVVNATITLMSGTAIKDAIAENEPSLPRAEVEEQYTQTASIAVFLAAVFAVLFVLLALQVRHGRGWARVVTWVVAGFGFLGGLFGLFASGTGPEKAVILLGLVVDAAIVVLLTRPRANAYFADR